MARKTEPDLESLYSAGKQTFAERVARIVNAIPRGKTMAYSTIAGLAGRPGGARAVTRVLSTTKGLPWWRVIRRDGTVAIEVAEEQSRRLRAEGVKVVGRRVIAKLEAKAPKKAATKAARKKR